MYLVPLLGFFICKTAFNPNNSCMCRYNYYLHYTNEETEAQRGEVIMQGHTASR